MLKNIILKIVEQLLENNIEVVAITCDQGASNRAAYEALEVNADHPYIIVKDRQIVCLYDVPHLFKSVRNNLMDHDFTVDDDVISWKILQRVFFEDSGTIRAMHKLTLAHLAPDSFQKMNVKLATQIFSSTVATAIYSSIHTDLFTEEEQTSVYGTYRFISNMDRLFNFLNSHNVYNPNPDNSAISKTSNVFNNMLEMREWVKTWIKIGRKAYCFDGLIQTINGIELLWNNIKDSQDFLLTARLNQDPLENLFLIIRNNKGSYEKNPSVYRFQSNIKVISFHNMVPPSNSSYSVSDATNLLNLVDVETEGTKIF